MFSLKLQTNLHVGYLLRSYLIQNREFCENYVLIWNFKYMTQLKDIFVWAYTCINFHFDLNANIFAFCLTVKGGRRKSHCSWKGKEGARIKKVGLNSNNLCEPDFNAFVIIKKGISDLPLDNSHACHLLRIRNEKIIMNNLDKASDVYIYTCIWTLFMWFAFVILTFVAFFMVS